MPRYSFALCLILAFSFASSSDGLRLKQEADATMMSSGEDIIVPASDVEDIVEEASSVEEDGDDEDEPDEQEPEEEASLDVKESEAHGGEGDEEEHGEQQAGDESSLFAKGQSELDLFDIERTGWNSWAVVYNCIVNRGNARNKRVHVKPRGMRWSQLKNWKRRYAPNVLQASWNRPGSKTRGIKWSLGFNFSYGGTVNDNGDQFAKGRFLKNIQLVAKATCKANYNLKISVIKVHTRADKYQAFPGGIPGWYPEVEAMFSLKVQYMTRKNGKWRTQSTIIWDYKNGNLPRVYGDGEWYDGSECDNC